MPTLPSPSEGGDFELPPAGTHAARCYRIVDLGTQQVDWQGSIKHQHKIVVSWELLTELMEDDRPFTIHQRYTFSTFEQAKLRQHLESWRGRAFQDSDFGPGGFDISKLLGVPCLLSVVHDTNPRGTYANVGGVMKPAKGMEFPALRNPTALLWLSPEEFDQTIFDGLSDKLKETIKKSPEWAQMFANSGAVDPQAPLGNEGQAGAAGIGDLNDSIPFAPLRIFP
jgi:hypothetical protein